MILAMLGGFVSFSFTVCEAEDPGLTTGERLAVSAPFWGITGLLPRPAVRITRTTGRA
ncbi:hypothetical protein ACFWN1_23420 [Streptomyces sp. NPDC058459]|uniref:hypothetical protein n=1 Tax=Streptomyces sp. NPDC058459 TaxID=3346508 RepID=UPI00366071E5